MTVDELASALELTRTAVRSQLASLERDHLIEQRGTRRGASKPSRMYAVTAQAELAFSRAYVPILTQLLHVISRRLPAGEFDDVMREVGREAMGGRTAERGPLRARVEHGSALLNELGGLSEVVEENGGYMIRSHGCPLAAATAAYPEACNAVESLLTEFVGTRVTKCCDRDERLRCCFEVQEEERETELQ
jgi:predicted ArsR family transcriptional regulator